MGGQMTQSAYEARMAQFEAAVALPVWIVRR